MRTIEWHNGTIVTFDQCRLPRETRMIRLRSPEDVAEAIRTMKIRGAPLLGATAGYALALTAYHSKSKTSKELVIELKNTAKTIRQTRPTAVNLFWALDRIMDRVNRFSGDIKTLARMVIEEAEKIADEDVKANRLIGKYGSELIRDGDTILTHCNAGALATVDYGTALGVIRAAWEQHKKIKVIATETRPRLQGARLTTYELRREGIPVTLITDNMVGYVMHKLMVDRVVVGADRIIKDGLVNKIGTFTVALAAKEHGIPFYVAAPTSTFDLKHDSKDVLIEEREPEEVTSIGTMRIAPEGVKAFNPAFDITPLEYVTAIICEKGVIHKADYAKLEAKINK